MTDADRNPPERPPASAARASSGSRRAASGPKRRGAVVWQLLAFAVLLPVASLSIFRAVPAEWPTPVVQLLSFTPWMVIPAIAALALALLSRRVLVMAAAAVMLAAQLFWLWPPDAGRADAGASSPGPAGPTVPLTAMTINSRFGKADAAEIVRLVRENGVGLLTVQEHTQALEDRLAAEGLGGLLPHKISSPTDDGAGSATYSKYPMQAVGLVPDTPFQIRTVRLQLQDAGHAATLEVTNVHALPPVDVRVRQWRSDLAALGELIGRTRSDVAGPTGPGNMLLIGDFNATYDHAEFRSVLDGGPGGRKMVDVGTASGSRLIPTWPMEPTWPLQGFPLPGIAIDHLVTSPHIGSSGYAVHRVPGTDHAAVMATLGIPAAG